MASPDLIVVNAQLWRPAPSELTAFAVTEGRITAVGSDAEIRATAKAGTALIDAAGAAVLPGFHDAHIHPGGGGLELLGCDLSDLHDADAYAERIREYAAAHPDGWIVGSGWFGDVFPGGFPDRVFLDTIIGDRPAVFTSHDHHGAWVSTAALRAAGIDRNTPDTPAGRIERDEHGDATGMLLESAGELVNELLPPVDEASIRQALLATQEYLWSLGVTAWHDALLGEAIGMPDAVDSYIAMLQDGSLRTRVTGSIWWPRGGGPEHLDAVLERVSYAHEHGFPVRSIKVMQDGMCENCTAALLAPYVGVTPETAGESVVDPISLNEIVERFDREGLSVHFHGVGDRAVRECLDAVEHARKINGNGPAHQIAHIDLIDEADLTRFAELNVTANLQPLWARDDQEILERKYPLIGTARSEWHMAFGSLHRAGAHLAMGSDWPVTSPDPLWGLHTACMRTAPKDDAHALNPESRVPAQPHERLDVADAIRAYTLGSAEIAGNADEIGSIDVGKLADFVVLDGPINGAESIDVLRVARTVLDGETVYLPM